MGVLMVLWLGFFASAAAIVYSGAKLSRYGDVIAEKTGLGRTWIGVLVMASVTSLPELMTGASAVTFARAPDIAVGSVTGSCVFNLVILGCLDLVEREKPLSAKAQQGHVLSGGFGILMLSIVSLSLFWGDRIAPFGWIGVYSLLFAALYVIAIRLVYSYEKRQIARFIGERAEEFKYEAVTLKSAVVNYTVNALIVTGASVVLPGIGKGIAASTGLGQSFVGNIFIAATTSLPEVVISLAAVRIGAIDLAIGNLLGSNIFNVCILAVDDFLFFDGPLLSSVDRGHVISCLTAIAMTSIVIIGLTYRSEKKFLFLAWDSLAIILMYPAYLMLLYAFI
jgi:cation:H+ antiporter